MAKTAQHLIILSFTPQNTNQLKRQFYAGNILDSFLISNIGGLHRISNRICIHPTFYNPLK